MPSNQDKQAILSVHLQSVHHTLSPTEIEWLANHTNGFTGADLRLLLTETTLRVLDRECSEEKEKKEKEKENDIVM